MTGFAPEIQEIIDLSFVPVDSCPVCSSNKHASFYSEIRQQLPLKFSKCNQCESLFQNPRLDMGSLLRYFNSEDFIGKPGKKPTEADLGYYDYDDWERSYEKNAQAILSLLKRYAPPPARLLEIGGATGWFLNRARQAGYDVVGLDISEALAAQVKRRHNIDVVVSSIENAPFEDNSFDIVCSFGGIACWYAPQAGALNIQRILKKDGIFCFNYTRHDSITAKLRGNKFFEYNHASLVIYSLRAMHQLLKKSGLSLLEEKIHWQRASVGRILSYLKFKNLYQIAKSLGLADLTVLCPAVGTNLVVARAQEIPVAKGKATAAANNAQG